MEQRAAKVLLNLWQQLFICIVASLVTTIPGVASALPLVGPAFVDEPPARLEFANNTDVWVSCTARGQPEPTVRWTLAGGAEVTVPATASGFLQPQLRTIHRNGTLAFSAFRPEQYRQDVHAATYRCEAANALGTVVSREMWVRAVVVQNYEVQVYDEYVITGNTGVLKCHIPSFVTDYVTVTDWIRQDTNTLQQERITFHSGSKFAVLPSGELHVHNVSPDDGSSRYNCRTLHRLTGEAKLSSTAGRLIVTAPQGSVPPRITDSRTVVEVEEGSAVVLPCAAQGYPVPSYNWYIKRAYDRWEALQPSRALRIGGSILISRAESDDSTVYVCAVNNSIGSERIEITLVVTVPLSVRIEPDQLVVDLRGFGQFRCQVTGHPVSGITWMRNGRPVNVTSVGQSPTDGRMLYVNALTRNDVGMYQCFARNSHQVVHASAELRIGDAPPEMHQRFISRAIHPGTRLSLTCAASGNPPPEVTWSLDGTEVTDMRAVQGSLVNSLGHTVSFLNVSYARVEDGGEYKCTASNRLGKVFHLARINVYGHPYIRPSSTHSAMASSDVIIKCPYSGYPIETIYWEKDSLKLPLNRRHRVYPNGTLHVIDVQPQTDAGSYTCVVQGAQGQTASRDLELAVLMPPGIAPFAFQGDQFVEGMRVRATCYVSRGDLPISIVWIKDGRLLSSEVGVNIRVIDEYSNLLTIDSVNLSHTGNYTCQATNSVASANYTAQLFVSVPPKWVLQPKDSSASVGGNLTLHCSARGSPPPTITWLRSEGDYREVPLKSSRFEHLSNGSLLLGNLKESDEGEYVCQANNGIGSGLSRVVYVGVEVSPYFDRLQTNYTLSKGSEARMVCAARGDLPITITWLLNSQRVATNQSPRYTISEKEVGGSLVSELLIRKSDSRDSATFRCQANNSYGIGEAVHQLIIQEPPNAPNHLSIVRMTSRTVRLTWAPPFDGNTNIMRYVVQYKRNSEPWSVNSPSQYVGGKETEVDVVGLLPGIQYQLRVLAENKVGLSPPSEVLAVTTEQEAPGGAPQNVQVQASSSQSLKVSWKPPKQDLSYGSIIGYVVAHRLINSSSGSGAPVERTVEASEQERREYQLLLSDLRKFARYGVAVRAYNRHGRGPSSGEVVASTMEDVPSKPPRHFACSAVSSQSLKLNWDSPPPTDTNGAILGYKVFYRLAIKWPGGATTQSKTTMDSNYLLQGLEVNSNYSIQVLAYTKAGDGARTEWFICSTDEDVPDAPADIKAFPMTPDAILVTWRPPIHLNGALTRYTVYIRTLNNGQELEIGKHSVYPTQTLFEATTLTDRYRYEFWVTASTSVGEGKSTKVIGQSLKTAVPAKIASFDQQMTTKYKGNLTLPCRAVGLPVPQVHWKQGSRQLDASERMQLLKNGSLLISSVRSSDSNNYSCEAKNPYGSDAVTYHVIVLAPPSPHHFKVTSTGLHSITIQWDAAINGGSPIVGYSLSYRRDRGEWEELQVDADARDHTLEALLCGTRYELYMTAYNVVGPGKPSDIVSVKTKGSVPVAPLRDAILKAGVSSVTLSPHTWGTDGCPVSHFALEYRKAEGAEQWMLQSNFLKPSREVYVMEDLQPNTKYIVKVTAHNQAGSATAEFAFKTLNYHYNVVTSSPTLAVTSGHEVDDEPFYLNLSVVLPLIFGLTLVIVLSGAVYLYCRWRTSALTTGTDGDQDSRALDLKYKLAFAGGGGNGGGGGHPRGLPNGVVMPALLEPAHDSRYPPLVTSSVVTVKKDPDVNPYATYKVIEHTPDSGNNEHLMQLRHVNSNHLNHVTSNYPTKFVKTPTHGDYKVDHTYSDDTVPDLLYRSNDSSLSEDGACYDVVNLQEISAGNLRTQHPSTQAGVQEFWRPHRSRGLEELEEEELRENSKFQMYTFPEDFPCDAYPFSESEYHRGRLMDCMIELKSVIRIDEKTEARAKSGSFRSPNSPPRHWSSKKHSSKQTIL